MDLIEHRVQEDPANIACWFEGGVETIYLDLWALVECVCEVLSPYYSQRNARVAIFMDVGVERIASVLTVLKSGFAYVAFGYRMAASSDYCYCGRFSTRIYLSVIECTQKASIYPKRYSGHFCFRHL